MVYYFVYIVFIYFIIYYIHLFKCLNNIQLYKYKCIYNIK